MNFVEIFWNTVIVTIGVSVSLIFVFGLVIIVCLFVSIIKKKIDKTGAKKAFDQVNPSFTEMLDKVKKGEDVTIKNPKAEEENK